MTDIFSGKFKINARAFGGLGLLLIILIIISPLWASFLETGIIGELPSSLVQQEEGARAPVFNSQATVPLLAVMVGSFLAFVFLYRVKRKRARG
jgi:hypothetical protein